MLWFVQIHLAITSVSFSVWQVISQYLKNVPGREIIVTVAWQD